jgi:hypothetical protein
MRQSMRHRHRGPLVRVRRRRYRILRVHRVGHIKHIMMGILIIGSRRVRGILWRILPRGIVICGGWSVRVVLLLWIEELRLVIFIRFLVRPASATLVMPPR